MTVKNTIELSGNMASYTRKGYKGRGTRELIAYSEGGYKFKTISNNNRWFDFLKIAIELGGQNIPASEIFCRSRKLPKRDTRSNSGSIFTALNRADIMYYDRNLKTWFVTKRGYQIYDLYQNEVKKHKQ